MATKIEIAILSYFIYVAFGGAGETYFEKINNRIAVAAS